MNINHKQVLTESSIFVGSNNMDSRELTQTANSLHVSISVVYGLVATMH